MDYDSWAPIIAGLVRHLIGAGGAALATHGIAVTSGQMDTVAGAIMVLVALGWSAWQKTQVVPKA